MDQSWRFCESLLRYSAAMSMEKLIVGYIRVRSSLGKSNHTWELRILAQYLNLRDSYRV